ncbi:MAG: helicase-associated domain-containing protein [Pseudonocardiaceae bacterium]
MRQLGVSEQAVRAGVAELRGQGLAWDSCGVMCLPERLETHWCAEIGSGRPVAKIAGSVLAENLRAAVGAFGAATDGLRKPELTARLSELMADLPSLARVITTLPVSAKERLGEFRRSYHGYYYPGYSGYGGSRPRGRGDRDSTELLIAACLLLPVNHQPELPREVTIAGWLAERELALTGRPDIPPACTDEAAVRRAAQAAVQEALRGMTTLLDEARATPIAALKKGGVGARERTRLAKRLSLPEDVLVLWLDLAYAAGLLGQADAGYAPTRSMRDGGPQSQVGDGRRWLMRGFPLSMHRPAGKSRETRSFRRPCRWGRPLGCCGARCCGPPVRARRSARRLKRSTGSARCTAMTLGNVATRWSPPSAKPNCSGSMVSELGEHLLAVTVAGSTDAVEELAGRCAALLPEAPCSVILQSDLTAVVSGQPSAAVSRLLNESAAVETLGAARTWRFTPASVRAALDAGRTAQELLTELAAISTARFPSRWSIWSQTPPAGTGRFGCVACAPASSPRTS